VRDSRTNERKTQVEAAMEFDHQPRMMSWRAWLLAGVGALAFHVAVAGGAVSFMGGDPEEDVYPPAIEVGFELASAKSEPTDLPPGPESDASTASPAVQEQKAVTEQTDLPKDTPVESETPDRIVTQNDAPKVKEEEQTVAKVETAPSEESAAAEATAPQTIERAPEALRTVAPAQRLTWQKELVAHFDRHKRYPAGRAAKATEIVVTFELDRTGHILSSSVTRSSGDPAFDEAALAMLKRSDPVPAPPPLVADEGLTFTLPVIFRVKGKG